MTRGAELALARLPVFSSSRLLSALRALVGERHVIDETSALLVYESDALPGYRKRPSLAVFPGTREEAIAVVRVLAGQNIPFVARGAGTGLSGGALADGVVLLGLQRLKRIHAIDPVARTATVEPGVVNARLSAAAAAFGLHYAPDPSSQSACTIGGNIGENAGGPHCLKYGVTMNHIVGATVVLPDGAVVELRVPASPHDGYDLMGAFVGSEGCFGIAVDVTVRLTPNPEAIRTLLADFMRVDDPARAVSAIVASGVVPAACELMDHGTIAAVEASIYAAGYPTDAAAVLLVEVDGAAPAVAEDAERVDAILRAHAARSVRAASDPADRARLWQGRKKAFGAMGRISSHLVVQDAVVPRARLAEILAQIGAIGKRHDITICNVFHAGDGNLHPNVPYDGRNPAERARVDAAMREIMTLCIAAGGTITGEHGVGLDKLPYMEQLFTPESLDAMCRLRDAFDPARRANPGKAVPVRSCREWHGATAVSNASVDSPEATPAPNAALRRPASAAEERLVAAITEARLAGRRVAIVGARTRVPEPPSEARPLDVRDHAAVVEYVAADLTITVGAGMTLAQLNAVTAEHNQWCPLLPWGPDDETLGGVLACAARGPASAALGAPRDLTLGMTFVDGRSAIVRAGGRVVKNVAGFDLTRTLVGSHGSLGVITQVSLRLRARPPASETWAIANEGSSADAVRDFARGPVAPVACEQIDASAARALGLDAEPHVIVWLAGGIAHVAAARASLHTLGRARELPETVWRDLRARGPLMTTDDAHAMSDGVARLNERVRRAFDPDGVFASPMWAMREDLHAAALDG